MAVAIITDSGCDFTPSEAASHGIDVVPMYIVYGQEKLRDGVEIDRAKFYERRKNNEQPTTEPPSSEDFYAVFERHVAAGDEVIHLSISSQISKAYENAKKAAEHFAGKVHVIDTGGNAGLLVLEALYARELIKTGLGLDELLKRLAPAVLKHAAYFAVPDMSGLGRSGRLPKAVVALGSMLNVSLVMRMNETGAVVPAGQSRSFDKTCEIMVDAVVRAIEHSPNARVAISHVEALDTAHMLSKQLEERLGHPPRYQGIHEAALTIATHLGNGAVGIFAIVP